MPKPSTEDLILRFLFGVGGVGCSVQAMLWIVPGEHVLAGLFLVFAGVWMGCVGFGLKKASAGAWAFRAVIPALAYCAHAGHVSWPWTDWILWVALIAIALIGQHIAEQIALGFIIDDHGERQRVQRWNRGYAIYEPTTHGERIVQESNCRLERRRNLFWLGLLWGGLAVGAYFLERSGNTVFAWMAGCFGALWFLPWSWEFVKELAYLCGYQFMKGAKVLDSEPVKPGLDRVAAQKVHGDAEIATVEETLSALR